MYRFTIRDVLWLTVVVGLACGWYAASRSWKIQQYKLIGRHDKLKNGIFTAAHKNRIELQRAHERHRVAEQKFDAMNRERMKVVKVAAELKKELGLQPPAPGNGSGQLQRLWEANQIFALENKVLKSELEAIKHK